MKRRSKPVGKAGKAAGRTAARPKRAIRPERVPGRRSRITQETEIARLTRERDEALEREKAATEVLHVISSSSGDLNSVFNLMLENASRICGADFGFMYLYENDFWRPVALRTPPKFAEWLLAEPRRWGPETALGRLATSKRPVQINDLQAESVYQIQRNPFRVAFVELTNAHSFVAVPLLKEENYEFGDVIVHQGDPADSFYVLISGRARAVKTDQNGNEIALATLRPGDVFGEAALGDGGTHNAMIRCSTAVTALRLRRW